MHGLLTDLEDKTAATQGWGLYHVYDLAVSQWVIRVLPAEAAPNVTNLARAGDALAIKTLRILMHGPQKETK